jgi:hypothetical protein
MKNRSWYCYALDFLGLAALAGAAASLAGAYWLNGTASETSMLSAFQYCLGGAVATLLLARTCEIAHAIRGYQPAATVLGTNLDNIEDLPRRDDLPRAA